MGLTASTALLSCEESVADVQTYIDNTIGPYQLLAPDKEHVVVGIHIELDKRGGILIADPGYHVARVVTVMMDKQPPHTGFFNQIDEPDHKKDLLYVFNKKNSSYVEWHNMNKRPDRPDDEQVSLIYIDRPYCDAISITEKRNLVYKFKSILSRDYNGKTVAGLYFVTKVPYDAAEFTFFYHIGENKFKHKMKFKDLLNLNEATLNNINTCNTQMKFTDGKLFSLLQQINKAVADESFISQCLEINKNICQLCTDKCD